MGHRILFHILLSNEEIRLYWWCHSLLTDSVWGCTYHFGKYFPPVTWREKWGRYGKAFDLNGHEVQWDQKFFASETVYIFELRFNLASTDSYIKAYMKLFWENSSGFVSFLITLHNKELELCRKSAHYIFIKQHCTVENVSIHTNTS